MSETSVNSVSKLRFLLHLWAGICLKAAADSGGVFSQLARLSSGDHESALQVATFSTVLSVMIIGVGYFLSHRAVSALDGTTFTAESRKIVLIILPFLYFTVTIPLAMLIETIIGKIY